MSDKKVDWEEEMRIMFDEFDIDGDGEITATELNTLALSLGEELSKEDIRNMINQADINNDGKIDFQEFKKMTSHLFKKSNSD